MHSTLYLAVGAGLASLAAAAPADSSCRAIPGKSGWPTAKEWSAFNKTVSGRLVKNVPVAAVCYKGQPQYNAAACKAVESSWTDTAFQALFPIGYSYPHTQSCDIPGGNTTHCSLGDMPVYSINASTPAHVVAGVNYAREKNLRLTVKMTGHDLVGRSTGFGSLEIWIAHLQSGITYEKMYKPTKSCYENFWNGAAIEVAGGYHWQDVYEVARAHDSVVVGGGCPDVGAIGGYTQGGGHSLAMHDYGLGADNLLEANVVLADGTQVLASPCENADLLTALRGGGGGTYGVVTSAKIKAHPSSEVSAQSLAIFPNTPADMPKFMEAVGILYAAFPSLQDGGLNGYGSWSAYSPVPVVGNSTTGLISSMGAFNKSVPQVKQLFAATQAKLDALKGHVTTVANYTSYKTYFDYYYATSAVNSAGETGSALVSRLLTKASLANSTGLAHMLNVTAGTPDQFTFNEFGVVGGGAVLIKPDPFSGVNPAWRKTYVMNIVARGWAETADYASVQEAHHDITYVKGAAMTAIAPHTGSYMGEGDWQDPNYLVNYYGGALPQHEAAKKKFDPNGVFYCPTCVGADQWTELSSGQLCKK